VPDTSREQGLNDIVLRTATWDDADHLLRLATLAGPEIAETFGS
jgi:hypothetical protein